MLGSDTAAEATRGPGRDPGAGTLTAAMELLLIRHGLPVRIESDREVDPGLTPLGHDQARALATWLEAEPPDALVTSPMARAVETAAPLAERFGLTPVVDDDLAELDRGATVYIPLEEIKGTDDPRWLELMGDWVGPAGAARRVAFQARVVAAVERQIAARPGSRVAVVCHGGVINTFLSSVLGTEQTFFFEPHYTSISRVLAHPDGRRQLHSVNETAHLRSVGDALPA